MFVPASVRTLEKYSANIKHLTLKIPCQLCNSLLFYNGYFQRGHLATLGMLIVSMMEQAGCPILLPPGKRISILSMCARKR